MNSYSDTSTINCIESITFNAVPVTVALVHDWLTGMRGGEKVLDAFCRRFPDAPLWTLLYNRGSVSPRIAGRVIHKSLLQYCPFSATKYRSYLPLFPLFAETNKADAQVVISTSHAVAKSMVKRGVRDKQLHLCYIHTPMRYAWDLFDEYFGADRVGAFASRVIYKPILSLLRKYDLSTLNRVDVFIANSTFVAERIKRIYGRDAEVLPPPVNLERFANSVRMPEDWYLVVSALVPYKRVQHAIEACAKMNRRLKIVGSGPELNALTQVAIEKKAEVEFLGFVPDESLSEYYCRAKALLFPGIEDFGIVPVESIAAGCPVVAFAQGGILDSMTSETCVFYSGQSAEGLTSAMREFEARQEPFSIQHLKTRAALFSEEAFLIGFERILQRAMASKGFCNRQSP
jgi:glycosyltransferase involved in cell wall biosynthesis